MKKSLAGEELLMDDETELALRYLQEGRVDDEALRVYRSLVEQQQSLLVAHQGLARCEFARGRYGWAQSHYQEINRLFPQHIGLGLRGIAEIFAFRGHNLRTTRVFFIHAALHYLEKGEPEQCEEICQRVVEQGLEPIKQTVEELWRESMNSQER